jgi:mevalonate pyrophosphate decarboxylase
LECNDLETMRQASLINDVDAIIRFIEPDALEMLAIHVQSRLASQ